MNPIRSQEGWFVLHLYCAVNRRLWSSMSSQAEVEVLEALNRFVQTFRQMEHCQLNLYSIWGHKADFGAMFIDPDLDHLNEAENELIRVFPPGVLRPVYSFVSMTEVSEYISQEKDYGQTLQQKEGLVPDSAEYQQKMEAFRSRIKGYVEARLFPQLPAHRVMCFYPMNKARRDASNWYTLDFETRKQLMGGHLMTGRQFAGKVSQLVSGSFGLDHWEWGVTLFTDDPVYLKKILYQMRYDEVSAVYGEFGDFLVGIRMEPEQLIRRILEQGQPYGRFLPSSKGPGTTRQD